METKLCNICNKKKPVSEFYKASKASRSFFVWACKNCFKILSKKAYRQAFKKDPDKIRERKQKWQEQNRDKQRIAGRKHRLKIRFAVIQGYGGKCECCGEKTIEFLGIDHIKGGGKIHRKRTNGHTYSDLLKRNFPTGYQVLCHNCNLAKGFYKICPHKRKK